MKKKNFTNGTLIIRGEHNKENTYTTISSEITNDTRLDIIDIGIMTKILSNSNEFILHKSYIENISGFGKTLIDRSFKKLEEFGYLTKVTYSKYHYWVVNETPSKINTSVYISNIDPNKWTLINKPSFINPNILTLIFGLLTNNNKTINNTININKEKIITNDQLPSEIENSFSSLDNSFEKDSKEEDSYSVEEDKKNTSIESIPNEKDTSIDYFKEFNYYEDPSYTEYSQFNHNKGMDLLEKIKNKPNFPEDKLLQLTNGSITSIAIENFKSKEKDNIDPLNVFCNYLVKYSSTEKNNPIWENFLFLVKRDESPIIYKELFNHFDLKLDFLSRLPKEEKNIKNLSNEEVYEMNEINI